MRIAINTRFLLSSKMEGFGWFTYETVKRMVEDHPDVEFIFFFDRPYHQRFIFGPNVTPVVLHPQARHPILFRIWFNLSVHRALKKYKADLFFSPDGYLSLPSSIPQIGVIHDLNFEHYPQDIPPSARKYLLKYFPLFAKKATHIITVSQFSKEDIIKSYNIPDNKITVAHNGGSEAFHPLADQEKLDSRENFADGNEYFVFVGALHPRKNLNKLFEAFEAFKKETSSPTQLVIVGEKLWKDSSIEELYNSLECKHDIQFTGHLALEDLTKAVGGAKALVFPSYFEGFGIPLVEAMKAGVPVTCGNLTALPEVAGDAALFFDPFNINDIADCLKKLDTDANLCEQLSKVGLERSKEFSWDKTADIIWNVLESTLSEKSN
ncbi:MAG: glycosyltransferase family 1 protein [Crocinitomicaceae bacterium]